jgi:hypothetical protein
MLSRRLITYVNMSRSGSLREVRRLIYFFEEEGW